MWANLVFFRTFCWCDINGCPLVPVRSCSQGNSRADCSRAAMEYHVGYYDFVSFRFTKRERAYTDSSVASLFNMDASLFVVEAQPLLFVSHGVFKLYLL